MKALSSDEFEDVPVITTQDAEDITLAQRDIDDQINSIFAEVGSDNKEVVFHFQVWRVLKDQADMAFLFKGLVSDLPIMERLRDEYDGGKFFIQVYKNKKRYRQLRVTVEAPKKSVVPVAYKNDMSEMIKAISEQQTQQFNMLKETLLQVAGRQVAPVDPMSMMNSMMGALISMKDFITPPVQNTPVISPDKMIDVLLKGMEIGRDSGSGGETNFLDIVKEALKSPLLLSAASQITQLPAAPINRQPTLPPQGHVPQPVKSPEGVKMNKIIVHNLNMLLTKAENDSDPALYAALIVDNVPENVVKEYLLREDLIEELIKINPKVADHKEWFLELRGEIQGILTGEGEVGETDSHASTLDNITDNPGGASGNEKDA